jgi:hypothetical protein
LTSGSGLNPTIISSSIVVDSPNLFATFPFLKATTVGRAETYYKSSSSIIHEDSLPCTQLLSLDAGLHLESLDRIRFLDLLPLSIKE